MISRFALGHKATPRPERLSVVVLNAVNRLVDMLCRDCGTVRLMEVCGTHTMAISASGIRRAVDPRLRLLSGPGCPVCVTSQTDIDVAISIAHLKNVAVLTFGDMMRVPGASKSLEQAKADGADVRVVYSALDGLKMALAEPRREFVFLGVGFETTAPTVAATVIEAKRLRAGNYRVWPIFKLVPPALRAVVEFHRPGVVAPTSNRLRRDVASAHTKGKTEPECRIDGFILPGHVSTVIGSRPYQFLADEFGIPGVITGFEPLDILHGILMLLEQLVAVRQGGKSRVEVQYRQCVKPSGNHSAKNLLSKVFERCDVEWRGLGRLAESGLAFRAAFSEFDARRRYGQLGPRDLFSKSAAIPRRRLQSRMSFCRCGQVMMGLLVPPECRLFGRACTPERPVGPCMVSSEGACAAYYRYDCRIGSTQSYDARSRSRRRSAAHQVVQ